MAKKRAPNWKRQLEESRRYNAHLGKLLRAYESFWDDVEQVTITRGHKLYGRECTVVMSSGEMVGTVTNAESDWGAAVAAKAAAKPWDGAR